MPPKQSTGAQSSMFSLGFWMTPKPTEEATQAIENEKDLSPTEVVGSPTEVVENIEPDGRATAIAACEAEFAKQTYTPHDDDDRDDGLDTDEMAAISELEREAKLANATVHCHIGAKRPHDDDEPQQVEGDWG